MEKFKPIHYSPYNRYQAKRLQMKMINVKDRYHWCLDDKVVTLRLNRAPYGNV